MCEKHDWGSDDGSVALLHGDTIERMNALPENSMDAIVTDPPYGLAMDKDKGWDEFRAESFRAAAGETRRSSDEKEMQLWNRKWTRAALRVLKPGGYFLTFCGSRTFHRLWVALEDAGFELQDTMLWLYGQGVPKGQSVLKPAYEPIALAYKPYEGTRAANAKKHGTGNLNIDASRLEGGQSASEFRGGGTSEVGRWPANVLLDEVAASMVETQWNGASRFFYCPKVSAKERGDNTHPTVKPVALMRYLVKLATPEGGVVLDCFAGSGSTAVAAVLEGYACVAIDLETEFLAIARRRCEAAILERDAADA